MRKVNEVQDTLVGPKRCLDYIFLFKWIEISKLINRRLDGHAD